MSSTRIEALIDEVQEHSTAVRRTSKPGSMSRTPTPATEGLSLARRRRALRDASYYTLVIEASFVAIERTVEFRLLERGTMQPDDLPVPTLVSIGRLQQPVSSGESMAADLADLWRDHRAKTYYQDGLPSAGSADAMYELATELHAYVTGRSRQGQGVSAVRETT